MRITAFFILLFAITFTACDDDAVCLKGDGNVQEYDLDVSAFDRISLSGPIDLEIKQGATQSVIVRAESEMYSELEYKVSNKEFEIGYDNVKCFETAYGVTVLVTVPELKEISVSGESTVLSDGLLELDDLDINISGTAEIMLEGEAENCDIDVSGTIKTYNFGFINQSTDIDISGSAEMEIFTEKELDIRISGSAIIRYMGDPTIDKSVSGSLELIHIN